MKKLMRAGLAACAMMVGSAASAAVPITACSTSAFPACFTFRGMTGAVPTSPGILAGEQATYGFMSPNASYVSIEFARLSSDSVFAFGDYAVTGAELIAAGINPTYSLIEFYFRTTMSRSSSVTISAGSGDLYIGTIYTPEPATWAMMVIGFGAIGAAMRRRHASVRFA